MRVAFDVVPDGPDGRLAIHQRTTLVADLTERDHLRLTRAVGHCPVGRDFTKRAVDIEDVVELAGVRRDSGEAGVAVPPGQPGPAFTPGRVRADFLPATREWRTVDGRPILDQEGEVKAHVESGSDGAAHRWGFLGGHSSAGWAPRPSSYAIGALAASTLMTLRAAAGWLAIDPATLRVEVEVTSAVPVGGKESSQEAASQGRVARVAWRRTIRATGIKLGADPDVIGALARRDPIYVHIERGDLLASETIDVVAGSTAVPA